MPPVQKKELKTFLGIIDYLSNFSPSMAEACDPLRKILLAKAEWMSNTSYQTLFAKAKVIMKEDVWTKPYDETKPLYVETDASRVGLGGVWLQKRRYKLSKRWCTW